MPKKTRDKKPQGRPRVELSEKEVEQVEAMAGLGLNLDQISAILGINHRTLDRRIAEDRQAFEDGKLGKHNVFVAIEKGRAKGDVKLSQAAFKMATEMKHPAMTIFLCKVRLGWREQPERIDMSVQLKDIDDAKLAELGAAALETLRKAK